MNELNPPVSRFTPTALHDGRPGLRGGLHVDVREPEPLTFNLQPSTLNASAVLDFIASDETVDRYDEVISAAGWRLDNYRRNPVFQNAHQYGDIIFTLGKALVTEVREIGGRPALLQRIEFATDANPMARIAYGLYKGGFLRAVSVGFIPLKWQDGQPHQTHPTHQSPRSDAPRSSSAASASSSISRTYLEQELLEVSAVGIPANPNALMLGLKAGAVERNDLEELGQILRRYSDAGNAGAQLIKVLRQLRDVMG